MMLFSSLPITWDFAFHFLKVLNHEIVLAPLICFLCFILGVNAALANEEQADSRIAKTATTMTVERLKMDLASSFNGLFVPREEVAVGTSLSDERIATVDAEVSDHVANGQVLVRLKTAKLDHNLREN